MSTDKKHEAVRRWESIIDTHRSIIAEALQAATTGSVISSADEVTLATEDGQQLQITTHLGERTAKAKLASGGKTLDETPSGTFVVEGGESLTIENGIVAQVGAGYDPRRAWALFALLADPEAKSK